MPTHSHACHHHLQLSQSRKRLPWHLPFSPHSHPISSACFPNLLLIIIIIIVISIFIIVLTVVLFGVLPLNCLCRSLLLHMIFVMSSPFSFTFMWYECGGSLNLILMPSSTARFLCLHEQVPSLPLDIPEAGDDLVEVGC